LLELGEDVVELAAGFDEEPSDAEPDFDTLSPEDDEDESLPPPELEEPSFDPPSDFGADEDFDA
jgi:hypothetical protein